MRQLVLAAFTFGALITVANPASAQLTELRPGARVRIQAPGIVARNFEGTVLTRTADTIVVGSPSTIPVALPIARISSVEISRGISRGDGAIRGMKWGVPIMAAFGAMIAAAGNDGNCSTCDITFGEGVAVTAVFGLTGAFYGAGIGAIVGHERWEQFDLTPRTSLQLNSGRIGVSLQLGF